MYISFRTRTKHSQMDTCGTGASVEINIFVKVMQDSTTSFHLLRFYVYSFLRQPYMYVVWSSKALWEIQTYLFDENAVHPNFLYYTHLIVRARCAHVTAPRPLNSLWIIIYFYALRRVIYTLHIIL